jgi:hypothetical protein
MKSKLLLECLRFLVFIASLVVLRYAAYRHLETELNVNQLDVKAALEPFKELKSE